MKNLAFILEMIWLTLAIVCLLIGGYTIFSSKIEPNFMFFILSIVAFLMYMLRRNRRLKELEK